MHGVVNGSLAMMLTTRYVGIRMTLCEIAIPVFSARRAFAVHDGIDGATIEISVDLEGNLPVISNLPFAFHTRLALLTCHFRMIVRNNQLLRARWRHNNLPFSCTFMHDCEIVWLEAIQHLDDVL